MEKHEQATRKKHGKTVYFNKYRDIENYIQLLYKPQGRTTIVFLTSELYEYMRFFAIIIGRLETNATNTTDLMSYIPWITSDQK